MAASIGSAPLSTSCMVAAAVIVFETEASKKSVSIVTGHWSRCGQARTHLHI
jgi:hypothetical protein